MPPHSIGYHLVNPAIALLSGSASGVGQNRPLTEPTPDIDSDEGQVSLRRHEQCLERADQTKVIALGRLGWSLRRIQHETGVRRETASGYLKAAGIGVQSRGRPKVQVVSSKPAISVTTDCAPAPPAAIAPSASLCEPFREAIELGLRQGQAISLN